MHIRELRLKIADLQQAEAFYHGVLKLPVLEATSDHLILQAGSTRLVFEHQAAWQGKYHFAFEVPENQIDAAHNWISPKVKMAVLNGESLFTSSDHWNAHMLYFYDPAGNILEFIARHNQPNAATEPFSERSILAISEIGLATPDVQQTVRWLCDTLGVSVYDGQGSDTFSAIGDELGLLIVVKQGRNWYPETGILAGLHPVTVTIAASSEANDTVPDLPYHILRTP